jgi:Trypsin-like peptidase domain/BON domain
MRGRRCLAGLVLYTCVAVGAGAAAQPAGLESAQSVVVMVQGQIEAETVLGAGLVVGARAGRLYVATANHVVRRGAAVARELTVNLRTLPGERLPARVLEHADRRLDLAVLAVQGERGQPVSLDGITLGILGSPGELTLGDNLHAIGNPLGSAWQVNLNPFRYRRSDGDQFRFEALSIQPGHSGGGVFDQQWRLVGMVVQDEPPDGVALSIARIVALLKEWGYPVALTPARPSSPVIARPEPARETPRPPTPGGQTQSASLEEVRRQILTALKANRIEGLTVEVDPQLDVALAGALPDLAAVRTALRAPREVRGVRSVSYNLLVKGSQETGARARPGPPLAPDVLQAKILHSLNRSRVAGVRVEVDPALNVHLSGTVADTRELGSALSAVTAERPRSLKYEIAVVGRDGR